MHEDQRMAMNFMKIDQVVMSGDGFYQSMAYHAYQSLPLASFALQWVLCVLSIATGYAIRSWVLARWLLVSRCLPMQPASPLKRLHQRLLPRSNCFVNLVSTSIEKPSSSLRR
jgi:hypothetical protein